MELSDVERRALKVLDEDAFVYMPTAASSAVRALVRAGLLVTPLHERALEACKQHYKDFPTTWNPHSSCGGCSDVGREALAAEKPNERWTVVRYDDNSLRPWRVFDAEMPNGAGGKNGCCAKFSSEADARAYAAQKNREQEGK